MSSETSNSAAPRVHVFRQKKGIQSDTFLGSARRDSNPRPRPWQGRAPPTEPLAHILLSLAVRLKTSDIIPRSVPKVKHFFQFFYFLFLRLYTFIFFIFAISPALYPFRPSSVTRITLHFPAPSFMEMALPIFSKETHIFLLFAYDVQSMV